MRHTHTHVNIVHDKELTINQTCSTTSVFIMLLLILCVVSSIFRNASIGDEWLLVWTTNKAIAMQTISQIFSFFVLFDVLVHCHRWDKRSLMNNEQHYLVFLFVQFLKLAVRCRLQGQKWREWKMKCDILTVSFVLLGSRLIDVAGRNGFGVKIFNELVVVGVDIDVDSVGWWTTASVDEDKETVIDVAGTDGGGGGGGGGGEGGYGKHV